MEKINKKMLKASAIKPNVSPYSSPVRFVKKKDGSWRMCVNDRALNNITMKDKNPIPMVHRLLDELEVRMFSLNRIAI